MRMVRTVQDGPPSVGDYRIHERSTTRKGEAMQPDVSARLNLTESRLALMHLMRNHRRGHAAPTALLNAVEEYLRLYPGDDEVRKARDEMVAYDERISGA